MEAPRAWLVKKWRARARPTPARALKASAVGAALTLGGALAGRHLLGSGGDAHGSILDPAAVSVERLLAVFQDTKQYLPATGWHAVGGTFAPADGSAHGGSSRLRRGLGRLRRAATAVALLPVRVAAAPVRLLARLVRRRPTRAAAEAEAEAAAPGPAPEPRQVRVPRTLVGFQKSMVRVPRSQACGTDQVRELHHLDAVMPGVDPLYLMEVMTNPSYGVHWNPSVRRVVLRQHRHLRQDVALPGVFTKDGMRNPFAAGPGYLLTDSGREWDVTAQVTEMPIPRILLRLAGGRRYTADFIAARYDCKARRGFTLATSLGTEEVAEAAGVAKGQELCFSAMMIAPVVGDWNGTRLHIVTHFDPRVPSAFRNLVHANVGKSLRAMMVALHKQTLAVQASGRHPYVRCP